MERHSLGTNREVRYFLKSFYGKAGTVRHERLTGGRPGPTNWIAYSWQTGIHQRILGGISKLSVIL